MFGLPGMTSSCVGCDNLGGRWVSRAPERPLRVWRRRATYPPPVTLHKVGGDALRRRLIKLLFAD